LTIGIQNLPERECEWIGLIMQSPVSANEYAQQVPTSAFTNKLTGSIWQSMIDLTKAGTQISVSAVRERVRLDPNDYGIPSLPSFLSHCMRKAGSDISLDDLAGILVDEAHKRQLWEAVGAIQKDLSGAQGTGEEIALKAIKSLTEAISDNRAGDTITLYEAAELFYADVSKSFQRNEPMGSDWGLKELDKIMGMVHRGDLGILGGPSGHGKSALAMQIGMHFAKRLPVLMIQAEMRHQDVAGREVLGMSGVASSRVETGAIQASEIEAIYNAAERLKGIPFEVTYTDDMRISRIRSRIQSFKHRHGACGLVIIDTIKHVDPEEKGAREGVARVMAAAPKLDKMAKALDVPIMALAQVKQTYADKNGESFSKFDLFGGGDLCEVASWVLLMHQPHIRAETNGGKDSQAIIDKWEGNVWVRSGKRRRGKEMSGKLVWVPERTRFADPDDDVGETFL